MKKTGWVALFAGIIAFGLLSCEKSDKNIDSENKARVQIRLTDDPGDYEAVWIDIKDVQVNVTNNDDEGWESLEGVHAGSYDLLKLVNDKDTLLVDAFIPAGRLHQIRLILGTENYVQVNGNLIKLTTPSAQQSGLKLNFQQDVEAGLMYSILLDFDVARSIVETGNDKYILKPVIRGSLESVGGSISGVVVPADFPTVIYAILGNDTITSTFTDFNGAFTLRGLTPDIYRVSYLPGNVSLRDTSVAPVVVSQGNVIRLDTMFLQP
ncbi:MAG: DUF4382 domain-containing protein [Chitinophagaceae bacterium]|nr:DUF4382 domain-containing protein [Chitinophagaceae bacterium]